MGEDIQTVEAVPVKVAPAEPFDAGRAFEAFLRTRAAHIDRMRDFDERHNEHSELFTLVRDCIADLHACFEVVMGVEPDAASFTAHTRNFAWGE